MPKYDVISFLSDMGTSDESVGVCKAIMIQQAPHAKIIDITHDVKQFDVRAGALALTRAIQFLPNGVVVAAVDPGSPRDQRYIAVQMEEGILIGPDNGILAPATQLIGLPKKIVELTNLEYQIESPGNVFAARDVLAPAAGVLASGTDISVLGNEIPVDKLVPGMLQLSRHDQGGAFLGEVWSLDHFGNVQLNITPEEIASKNVNIGDNVTIRINNKDYMAKYVERYADLGVSQLGILVDSTGMISIVKNLDFAAKELEAKEGKEIIILAPGTSVTGIDIEPEYYIENQARTVDAGSEITIDDVGADQPRAADPFTSTNPFPQPLPAQPDTQQTTQNQSQIVEPQQAFVSRPEQVPQSPVDPFVTTPVQQQKENIDPLSQNEYVTGPGPQPQTSDPFSSIPQAPNPVQIAQQPNQQAPATYQQDQAQTTQSPTGSYATSPIAEPTQSQGQQTTPAQSQQFESTPAYFPPPVQEPSAQTPSVTPTYTSEENQQDEVVLPQNVFDLFKEDDQEQKQQDTDQ